MSGGGEEKPGILVNAANHKVVTDGVLIPLNRGMFAIVDEADAARVLAHNWSVLIHKTRGGERCYAIRGISLADGRNSSELMHRFLLSPPPGYLTEHLNDNRLDNRRKNLRVYLARMGAELESA